MKNNSLIFNLDPQNFNDALESNTGELLTPTPTERPTVPIQYNPRRGRFKPKNTKKPNAKNKQILRYPLAVLNESTDYLHIKVLEYEEIGGGLVSDPTRRQNNKSGKSILQDVILPMPSNVQDGNTVSYSDSNMNTITAAALKGITNFMDVGENFTVQSLSDTANDAKTKVTDALKDQYDALGGRAGLQSLATKYFASQAISVFGGNVSVNQLLAREQGIIFNPNMELLFNGPTLRGFGFSFKFTPRTKEEAEEVKTIIRVFKQYMAPKTTTSGAASATSVTYLGTPSVFELSYRKGSGEHPYLNKFKQCFLENMSVNYTGEGTYATYEDGEPISMIMTLQFKEIQPIYDEDYDERDTTVGY
jgi:hypothetical protein